MKILGQFKVKAFTRRLPRCIKIAETSNYAMLAMKGPEVAFEITLASCRGYDVCEHRNDQVRLFFVVFC